MFAPEGYLLVEELYDRLGTFSFEKDMLSFDTTPASLKEYALWRYVLDRQALRICSPEGAVLKVSRYLLDKVDLYDVVDIPSDAAPDLSGCIPIAGCWGDDRTYSGVPLFYSRASGAVSLDGYRTIRRLAAKFNRTNATRDLIWMSGLEFENDPFWTAFEKFEGWAICCPEESLEKQIDLHLSAEREITLPIGRQHNIGRPRKIDRAMVEYHKLYPCGHGDLTWAEVAVNVAQLTGVSIGHETLMKAVNREKRHAQTE